MGFRPRWEIAYYFPGPDLRYNGEFVTIPSAQVDSYIAAFAENWAEYTKLRNAVPVGGEFSKIAAKGMTIRIGGYSEGVRIKSYHLPIRTLERLHQVVEGYRSAIARAPKIQAAIAGL